MAEKNQTEMKVGERRFEETWGKTLASKILHVQYKLFNIKVINEKQRGTIIKIIEFCNHRSNQIVIGLSAARELRGHLNDLVEFYASLLSVSRFPASTDTILKSVRMRRDGEKKKYRMNFMENHRGRFLKISETSSISSWDSGWAK